MNKNNNTKMIGILIAVLLVVFVAIFMGVYLTQNRGQNTTQLDRQSAADEISKMIDRKIVVHEADPVRSTVDLLNQTSLADELPTLKNEDLSIQGKADIVIEVFASPEKAGEGTNSWMVDVAKAFNKEKFEVNGKTVAVSIRNVTSGLGLDYIISGVRVPEIYSPSSEFWGEMARANGVGLEQVSDGLAGNVAGIVISNDKYDYMVENYGTVSVQTIMQAVTDGNLLFGYTTPNTSSTGLNYVMFALWGADSKNPLSDAAINAFTAFQANIPFVAQTTMQMQKAADTGSLDAFVYESQVWENSPTLHSKYKFIPFGVRHDNPAYIPDNLSTDEREVVKMFIEYCQRDEYVKLAKKYGFNSMNNYVPEKDSFDGSTLLSAQSAWKENKDNGKTIVAVFVADVSGSMKGEPFNALQTALLNSMQYIGKQHIIGLVSYSTDVTILLRPGEFDLEQQSKFKGAVENMSTGGTTGTCNGLLVGIDLVLKELEGMENAEGMVFLLSDGDSDHGYGLNDIKGVISTVGIPVYTIGYNESVSLLEKISDINEAACINATSDDVVYKLKNLFNSNL